MIQAPEVIEYIEAIEDKDKKKRVYEMYTILRDYLDECVEVISYGMPAFRYKKHVVVYFSSAKNHIGYYPTNSGIEAFEEYLQPYKYSKGAIQFPYSKELDKALIQDIALFRLEEVKGKK